METVSKAGIEGRLSVANIGRFAKTIIPPIKKELERRYRIPAPIENFTSDQKMDAAANIINGRIESLLVAGSHVYEATAVAVHPVITSADAHTELCRAVRTNGT